MSIENTGSGTLVTILASSTFPVGVYLNEWSYDTDPIDFADLQIMDYKMGMNGQLVVWGTANPIEVTLAPIPGSNTDKQLSILLEANRIGEGKTSARDSLNMTIAYPDISAIVNLSDGRIVSGVPGSGIASAGNLKTKTYKFVFTNKLGGI